MTQPLTLTLDTTEPVEMKPSVPIEKWGKDHWSTFAYIETRIVDYGGRPAIAHMRCNNNLHPMHAHLVCDREYPTKLKGGETLSNHDDWSCLDDAEAVGFLENVGTGVNRVYRLTDKGQEVADKLRAHKRAGKNFAEFEYP